MEQSREEILANFQACTGIEDIADALNILEQADWDLMRAVNHAIPFDPQPNDSTTATVATSIDDDDIVEVIDGAFHQVDPQPSTTRATRRSTRNQHLSEASTSKPKSTNVRNLQFVVHFKEHVLLKYNLPDSSSILALKQLIAKSTSIPPCRQILSGWIRTPANDNILFSELSLPFENVLFLSSLSAAPVPMDEESDVDMGERLARRYALNVHDESSNKTYNLNFPGTRTVLEVKNDVYSLTDIPTRHQIWSGWPSSLDDNTCLALSGISYPSHDLTVKRSVIQSTKNSKIPVKDNNREKHRKIIVDLVDSDTSSVEEFEDASESFNIEDDIFIDVVTKKVEPLIPDNVEDEAIGCIHFSERFTARYGGIHPAFFTGTLEDALKDACSKPAKDRRLLALYLHHDASVLSNVFCTQLLGFESVLQTFEANFVVWGWDMTNESNKNKLLSSISTNLGGVATMTIRNIAIEKYPVLILIMRMRSATEIFNVIHGNVGVNELVGGLMEAVEVWTEQQRIEMREEQERSEREMVKREQDEAYQESLEADRAKEAFRQEQRAQIEEEQRRIDAERQEAAAIKEAHRLRLENSLPPEPSGASGDSIAQIRFRLPKGQVLDRKFLSSATLQILLNYLTVKGYPPEEYKVISSWPRRDLTTIDATQTLMDLKLYPQETVMIEER